MAAFRNLAYLFGSRSRPTFDDSLDDYGGGDDDHDDDDSDDDYGAVDDEAHGDDGGGDDGGCVRILHMLWRTDVKNIKLNIYLMIFSFYVIGFSSTNIIMGYILDH